MTMAKLYLWNWLVPVLFHGPVIDFWQALGLLVLSKILFRGFFGMRGGRHGGPMGHHWRKRWEEKYRNMTPEQREELRKKWNTRCGGHWKFPEEEKESGAAQV
jgi:hypothetical protein